MSLKWLLFVLRVTMYGEINSVQICLIFSVKCDVICNY